LERPEVEPLRSVEPAIHLRHERGGWQVRAEWQDRLFGPGTPDWFDLEGDPRATRIKSGDQRKTWRVPLGSRTVFAKVFDERGWLDRLKRWTLGDPAVREWRALRRAEALGVAVVRCLAVGRRDGGPPRSVVVSEGLEGAASLAEAWEQGVANGPVEERRSSASAIIEAVAQLLSLAHERGFVHGDDHPNNILVRSDPTLGLDARYLDVHSARIGREPVSVRRTLESLAQLDQYFRRRATRGQRLRFLRSYLGRRPSMRGPTDARSFERKLLSNVSQVAALHAARLARHRDRRLGRRGKYFTTFTLGGGWRVTVALRLERRHVFPESYVPDRTEDEWRAILDSLLHRVSAARTAREAFDHGGMQIEVGRPRRLVDRLRGTLLRTPHRRAFERCHALRHRDRAGELILAYGEHRSGGLVDRTLLVRSMGDASPDRTGAAS
jgi:RIO-like serine/threonine protein kinase